MLAAIGALLVLVSLFLDWFKPGLSAWTTFEALDLVLAAIAIAVLAVSISRLAGRGATSRAAWLPIAAIASLVIVIAALVNHPPAAIGLGTEAGIWLALGGTVLMVLGTLADHAELSLSFNLKRPEPGRPVEPETGGSRAAPPEGGETATRPIAERRS